MNESARQRPRCDERLPGGFSVPRARVIRNLFIWNALAAFSLLVAPLAYTGMREESVALEKDALAGRAHGLSLSSGRGWIVFGLFGAVVLVVIGVTGPLFSLVALGKTLAPPNVKHPKTTTKRFFEELLTSAKPLRLSVAPPLIAFNASALAACCTARFRKRHRIDHQEAHAYTSAFRKYTEHLRETLDTSKVRIRCMIEEPTQHPHLPFAVQCPVYLRVEYKHNDFQSETSRACSAVLTCASGDWLIDSIAGDIAQFMPCDDVGTTECEGINNNAGGVVAVQNGSEWVVITKEEAAAAVKSSRLESERAQTELRCAADELSRKTAELIALRHQFIPLKNRRKRIVALSMIGVPILTGAPTFIVFPQAGILASLIGIGIGFAMARLFFVVNTAQKEVSARLRSEDRIVEEIERLRVQAEPRPEPYR